MTDHRHTDQAKLDALARDTAASSNAGTVDAIAETGHTVSKGMLAYGAGAAAGEGMGALACFGGTVLAPIAGMMAGAKVADLVHADEAAFWVAKQFGAQRIAGPGRQAAHIRHQIAHDNLWRGLVGGLVAGALVGAAVVGGLALIIGTGGMAAPLVGAAVLGAGGFAGGFVAQAITGAGAKTASLSGPISSGSLDVYFEGKNAARVTDTAACTRHSPPPKIIEGSETVFINGLPMARIGHKLSCDAVVQQGCDTVFGDSTTAAYGSADADLSVLQQLALSVLEVATTRSAVREGGLLNEQARRVTGEPVDVVTGDYADQRVDLDHPGLIPLRLVRTYPGRMRVEGLLGPRWICSWSQRLRLDFASGTALLEDGEGQRLRFDLGGGVRVDATHLKAPYYRLTGTRERLRLFDSRSQQHLVFAPAADPAMLELAVIEDRSGNAIAFERDARGRLGSIRLADGTLLTVDTTPEGWMTAIRLDGEDEPLVRYHYDPAGRLVDVAGPSSGTFGYSYTSEGWLSGWRDGGPTALDIAYDAAGRVVATRANEGLFDDRFEYVPDERRTRYVDATGTATIFHYNADGLVTAEENALGQRTLSEWDALERLQRRIDPAGRETTFAYDGGGRLITATDWAGRTARWTWDGWGALTRHDGVGGTASWTRDAHGKIVAWEETDGRSGTARYDDRGRLVGETVAGAGTTEWEVDGAGRPTMCREPGGRVSRFEWDRFGKLLAEVDAAGRRTEWEYRRSPDNPRGAASLVRAPDGSETRFAYDGEGLIAERVRGEGQATRFVHGAFDTLRSVTDPLGTTTQFDHDGAGRLSAIADAQGQEWRFRYDAAGRLAAQVDWAGRETRYGRDVLGRVVARRMPDGAEQQVEWDERDRIVRVVAGDDAISYDYDDGDRLVRARTWRPGSAAPEPLTEVAFAYDAQGRLTGETQNGVAVRYRYDAAGRCTGRSSPSGETDLAFDEAGLLRRYASNGHALRFDYDASGMETLRQAAAPGARTAFQLRQDYDPCGRLHQQRAGAVAAFAPGGQPPAPDSVARSYGWDRAGRLTQVDDAATGATRFRYDLRDQATAVERPGGREQYRYDALMNLAEGLGGAHRYWHDCVVEAGPNRFRYDARGRMIEHIETADGFRPRRWSYAWDGFDRLVELATPDGARWRYTYDAFGRRVGKALAEAPGRRRTDYLWQGGTLAEAWHRAGDDGLRIERWHFEPDGVRPLARELVGAGEGGEPAPAGAQWLAIVADQVGAPHAMFTADGRCRWRAERRLWGRTRTARDLMRERRREGEAATEEEACALRFPGQWEDAESGLHYNLHRYYDPDTGQYLSPDPIGIDGGLRTHAYVHDPLGWMDPEGLAGCHGNSRANTANNHLYEIRDTRTGEVYKYGIGSKTRVRDGASVRAESQVRALNRQSGGDNFESRILKSGMTRGSALDAEQGRVNGYSLSAQARGAAPSPQTGGVSPPGNRLPVPRM